MASVPTSPPSSPASTSATTPGLSEQDRAAALRALTDAARFYRGQVERSWVPDYLNRRNLYSQFGPAGLATPPEDGPPPETTCAAKATPTKRSRPPAWSDAPSKAGSSTSSATA